MQSEEYADGSSTQIKKTRLGKKWHLLEKKGKSRRQQN